MKSTALRRPSNKTGRTSVHWWPLVCLAAITGFTLRLYGDLYLWLDDFNNLHLVQGLDGRELLSHVLDPRSLFFRPVGLAFYWVLQRGWGLDPFAFHATAWAIHAINVALVFLLLRRMVHSDYSAAAGATLFACQAMFNDIYWSFGTIFELVSTLLFLLAVYIQSRFKSSLIRIVALTSVFFLACKGKEMAITLPAVLVLYDWLKPGDEEPAIHFRTAWRSVLRVTPLFLLAAYFVFLRSPEIASLKGDPAHPYYMSGSIRAVLESYAWYIQAFVALPLRWEMYILWVAIAGLLMAWRRNWTGVFFLLYALVALAPVIPLVSHRFSFYWYLPFFGISGLAALAARSAGTWFRARMSPRMYAVLRVVAFALVCRDLYFYEKDLGDARRNGDAALSRQYRALVEGLRALPSPPPGEILYFDAIPTRFDESLLTFTAQLAFQRTDISARVVDVLPVNARYRLRFTNGRVEDVH